LSARNARATAGGVLQEIANDLRQAGAVCVKRNRARRRHQRQLDAGPLRQRPAVLDRAAGDLAESSRSFWSWTLLQVIRVTSRRSFTRLASCATCLPITCLARSA
jgi:hypothetical protein